MTLGSPKPDFPGTRRFEIVRLIGFGGTGVVYEAFDRERRDRVALKVLRALDAEARLRFKAEFRSLQDIQHPNLVSLGELHEESGQLFFTMELIRGVDFVVHVRVHEEGDVEPSSSLHGTPALPPGEALAPPGLPSPGLPSPGLATHRGFGGAAGLPAEPPRVHRQRRAGFDEGRLRDALGQVLRGLCTLHAADKVHRDIKPSNVLVTADGRVVILDFGLIADTSMPRREQGVAGTAQFIAPEQVAGGPIGPPADLYSAGVMLYLALTGEYPFRGSPTMALRLKRWVDAPPPSQLVPGLPRDLEALCVDLLRIEPAARPSGREVLRRLQIAESPEEPPAVSMRAAFVGRAQELTALFAALDEARAGHAVVQILEGESGVGKTALVRRFLERIGSAGETGASVAGGAALALSGRCHERESVPYKAVDGLIDALSLHLAGLPPGEAKALLPVDAGLLGAVFPVLRKVDAVAAAPVQRRVVDPPELRAMVFAAFRELFGRLAERRPLVLAIDDLQWADADSLALLSEVLRPDLNAGAGRAMLLVGVLRAGAGTDAGRLARRLALPPGSVRRLALGPLPPADAEELCALLLHGQELRWHISVRALVEESGGHPLFIDALVRHRLSHEDDDDGRPARLDEVLGARVAHLDPETRELLELAVVAGGPLYLDVAACALPERSPHVRMRRAAMLRAACLARTGGAGRDEHLEPYHSRIRESVLARLDAGVLRSLHGRLARALEASGRIDLTALAEHWRAAGEPGRAASYAIRAAEQAEAALAFDRAAQLYRAAAELLPAGGEQRRAVLVRLGSALSSAGQGVKAAEAYMAASDGAPPAEAIELGRRAAQSLLRAGYVEAGLSALRTVLTAVGLDMHPTPEHARASLVARRARLLRRGLAFTPRDAGQIPREELARIDVCWSAALGLAIVDPIRGADFQAQDLLLALRAGDPYRVTRAIALEAAYMAGEGDTDEGDSGAHLQDRAEARVGELLQAASALAEQIGSPHACGLVRLAEGVAGTFLARWSDAREALDRAEEIFREQCTGVAWERGAAQSFAVWALWYLGDVREFARRVPLYLLEAEERGDRYLATTLRSAQGNACWLVRGDPETALQEAQAAIRSWSRAGFHLQIYFDLIARAHIGLYRGDGAATHRLFAERWPGLEGSLALRIQAVRVAMLHLRACAALAAVGSGPDPDVYLGEAARTVSRLEAEAAPWASALAAGLRASLAAARGEDEVSAQRFAEAAQGFEGAGMALYAAAARRRAGELLGGEEGRAAVVEADRWMWARGVADPTRITAMLMPIAPSGSAARFSPSGADLP